VLRSCRAGAATAGAIAAGGTTATFRSTSFHPKSFNDAQQVADKFKRDIPVIINLQEADQDLPRRMIDFVSGLHLCPRRGHQRIADRVFMLTSAQCRALSRRARALIEKGFFNQA